MTTDQLLRCRDMATMLLELSLGVYEVFMHCQADGRINLGC